MLDPRIHKPLDQLKVATTALDFRYLNLVSRIIPQEKFTGRFYETEWELVNGARIYTSMNRFRRESYLTLNPGHFSSWKAVCLFLRQATGGSVLSSLRVIEYHVKVDLIGVRTDQIIREINPLWFREGFVYADYSNFSKGFAVRKTLERKRKRS